MTLYVKSGSMENKINGVRRWSSSLSLALRAPSER
jgi:uncharacterized protein YggU (UPF0235/DUF167 family)